MINFSGDENSIFANIIKSADFSKVFIVKISEKYSGMTKNVFLKSNRDFSHPLTLNTSNNLVVRGNPIRPVIFGNHDVLNLSVNSSNLRRKTGISL